MEKNTSESKGSYVVGEYADAKQEIDRLRKQAEMGFLLEKAFYEKLGIGNAKKVLDAGCGPGFVANEVKKAFSVSAIDGVDIDSGLIAIAKSELANVAGMTFQEGSVYELPVADDGYEFLYSRFVVQHLEKPLDAIKQYHSKLQKGGKIVIEDIDDGMLFLEPAPDSYEEVQNNAETVQFKLGGNRKIGRRLFSLLQEAGFSDVKVDVLPVTSQLIGMPAFIQLGFGFKFDHLSRIGKSEADIEKARGEFMKLAENPNAFGMLLVFFVSGIK